MMSALSVVSEAVEHHEVELPFDAPIFGLVALVIFMLLLAITWAFRNNAYKYGQHGPTGPRDYDATAAHEPGTTL